MERRQVRQRLEPRDGCVIDLRRARELCATVDDAVSDCVDSFAASFGEHSIDRRCLAPPKTTNLSTHDVGEQKLEARRSLVDRQDSHAVSAALRPGPLPDLGQVLEVLDDVAAVAVEHFHAKVG